MPELDPVTQRFIADDTQYLAAMEAMIAAAEELAAETDAALDKIQARIDALHGKTVEINVKTTGLGDAGAGAGGDGGAAAAAAAAKSAAAADLLWEEAVRKVALSQSDLEASLARSTDRINSYVGYDHLAAAAEQKLAIESEQFAGQLGFLVTSTGEAARATDDLGAAATRAWRPWFLFGNTWKTALHWIVAGSAEILAVTIPALIALGAGMFVALQGAQNMANHMQAVWTAFEAAGPTIGKTMGDFLGLGHAMQAAQDAANPGVYELLGSAINDAKTHFADFATTGLNVVHMLDEFSARITTDLQGQLGAQMGAFLNGMTRDLQQLGQVLGNFGHALLNIFSDMPGLVHILLGSLEAISRFALILSSAPAGLVMFAIGLEEVFRWGGLLLGVLTRLVPGARALMLTFAGADAGFIAKFASAFKALWVSAGMGIGMLGNLISRMGAVTGAGEAAGAAIEGFGTDVALAGAEVSTAAVAWGTLGVAALAGLAIALMHVKDAAGQMASSAVKAVQAAGDLQVLGVATNKLLELNSAAIKTNVSLAQLPSTAVGVSAAFGSSAMGTNSLIGGIAGLGRVTAGFAPQLQGLGAGLEHTQGAMSGAVGAALRLWASFSGASTATDDMTKFNAAEDAIVGTVHTVTSNIGFLAGAFHTSAVGALALANAAGVNLQQGLLKGTEAGKIAIQMINNLRAGLGAMAAPAGVVGADMEALGIQSQLAGTKVQQVNQSFDQFVGTLTGGMTGLAQFEGALTQMGHDAVSSSVGINGAINSISRSATKMGFTLQGMGPKAQQSWQQFSSATQQAESVIDTLRTGMAEGVVSWAQFKTGVQAAAGQLLPFAAKSKTALGIVSALAQQAGFPATTSLKTLATQLGVTGNVAKGKLVPDVEAAIARMSSMSTVARNLSAVVSGQLDQALASSITKFSGVTQAANAYAKDLANAHTPISRLTTDHNNLVKAMQREQTMQQAVTKAANDGSKAFGSAASATGKDASATNQAASSVSKHVSEVTKQVSALGRASGALTQQVGAVDRNASAHTRNASAVARASTALTTQTGAVDRNSGAANTATGAHTRLGTAVQREGEQARTSATSTNTLHTAIGGASTAAAGATGRMAQLATSEARVGSAAAAAAGQVRALAAAINSLHDKTVHVSVVTSKVGAAAQGTPSADRGAYLVGEQGPELVMMGGGERIFPAHQTASMLSALTSAAAAGDSGGTAEIHVHSHAYLDGKEVFNSVKTETAKYNTRNSGKRTGRLIPS